MPAKKRTQPAPQSTDVGSESTNRKPQKKKLQPFLESGQMVEDTELEGIAFNPIPPQSPGKQQTQKK